MIWKIWNFLKQKYKDRLMKNFKFTTLLELYLKLLIIRNVSDNH